MPRRKDKNRSVRTTRLLSVATVHCCPAEISLVEAAFRKRSNI